MDRILYLFLFHDSRSYDLREVLFYFVPVNIRYAFYRPAAHLRTQGTLVYTFCCFGFSWSLLCLIHLRLFSFFFVRLLFYLYLGNLQLVDVFMPLCH